MKKNIVILGAGMTGLSTAWKILQESDDCTVTLLERDQEPGGLAKSIHWNNFILDLGPHRFHTEIPEIKSFIKTFCEEKMLRVPRYSRMYLNGHYVPYPISPLKTLKALGLLKTIQFSISALAVLFRDTKNAASYEEYVIGYYGNSLYDRIFKPFAEKVWGLPPSRISAETARVRLRGDSIWHALMDSFFSKGETYVAEFLYPPNGIGQIASQFADDVEAKGGKIYCNHTAVAINHNENGIQSVKAISGEDTVTYPCDILVNTIPLAPFFQLLEPNPPEESIKAADDLQYRSLVLLYLLFEGEFDLPDTWLYFPEEDVPFTRISVPGNFIPTRQRDGYTCLCVEFTCEQGDDIWKASPDHLQKLTEKVLHQSGLIPKQSEDATTVHIKEGYPVYHIGYDKSLLQVLETVKNFNNCITTGRQGLFRHNNIDQAIQMGLNTAEQILSSPDDFDEWYNKIEQYNDYRIVD